MTLLALRKRTWATIAFVGIAAAVGCRHQPTCQTDVRHVRETVALATARSPEWLTTPKLPPKHPKSVLVLSGGGMYGAYTAGFLAGWTKTGTRPRFDVVTGISTGSLIATVAFLGPEFDDAAREFYTTIRAADIYTTRAWILVPWSGSLASSEPLRRLIDTVVDNQLVAHVAAQHRAGRRLYVGTTNIETRKLVIWDMGAIATRNTPEAAEHFRNVLLASCSVPGMLPPVPLTSIVNDKVVTERHVDGGVAGQLFIPPGTLKLRDDGSPSNTDLYVMISGKLFADQGAVQPRVLPVMAASAAGILFASCRAEVASLFHQSKATGANYNLTALPESDNGRPLGLSFDPVELSRLYDVGYCHGIGGPVWMTAPPFESVATDAPRE